MRNKEVTVVYNLVLEVASHHFYCILFVKNLDTRSSPLIKGGDCAKCGSHKAEIIGNHLRSSLPHVAYIKCLSLLHKMVFNKCNSLLPQADIDM